MIKKDTFREYQSCDYLNSTKVKEFNRMHKDPNFKISTSQPKTEAMLLGSLYHELLLEPALFNKNRPTWNMKITSKENNNIPKVIEAWDQNEKLSLLKDQIRNNRINTETSLYDEKNKYKSRADIISTEHNIIVDLKTTKKINDFYINTFYQTKNLFSQYRVQVGFYAIVYENITQNKLKKFVIIHQEIREPYQNYLKTIDGDHLNECIAYTKEILAKIEAYQKLNF